MTDDSQLPVMPFAATLGGVVTAVSRPLHTGRTVIVVQTDLLDDTGRPAAQVTQTQAVLGDTR